jgi:uncharacterized protein YabE (DUF348 family)
MVTGALLVGSVVVLGHQACAQSKDTVIVRPNGEQITVTTDRHGTRVIDQGGRVLTTSGGDRHQERVHDYTKDGGRVMK